MITCFAVLFPVQIVALLRAIDVRGLSLGILDVGGSEVTYVK